MTGRSVILGGWLLTMVACGATRDDELLATVRSLRDATVPAGAHLLNASPLTWGAWNVQATWDIETTLSRDEYTRRVGERLIGFHRHELTFTRMLPGDTQTVRIEEISGGPPLRVRIRFTSLAS